MKSYTLVLVALACATSVFAAPTPAEAAFGPHEDVLLKIGDTGIWGKKRSEEASAPHEDILLKIGDTGIWGKKRGEDVLLSGNTEQHGW
jgi:hypothetical protein